MDVKKGGNEGKSKEKEGKETTIYRGESRGKDN